MFVGTTTHTLIQLYTDKQTTMVMLAHLTMNVLVTTAILMYACRSLCFQFPRRFHLKQLCVFLGALASIRNIAMRTTLENTIALPIIAFGAAPGIKSIMAACSRTIEVRPGGTTAFTTTNDSYLVWTLFFYATIFT